MATITSVRKLKQLADEGYEYSVSMAYSSRWKRKRKNERKSRRGRRLIDSLRDAPCSDCGVKYPPYVMDFDHLSDKKMNVSKMVMYSEDVIREEVDKCEVVCSNCHRERTYQRLR